MGQRGVAGCRTLAAVTVSAWIAAAFVAAPVARADDGGLNGTFTATSNGDWAKTNEQYRDEKTVVSTWTIHTTCSTTYDCSGTVTSDLGWTARISTSSAIPWYVRRDIPDWEPCAGGGPPGHGRQTYMFYPVGSDGHQDFTSTTYAGTDRTIGDSGACGINKSLVIEMPLKLVKIG